MRVGFLNLGGIKIDGDTIIMKTEKEKIGSIKPGLLNYTVCGLTSCRMNSGDDFHVVRCCIHRNSNRGRF